MCTCKNDVFDSEICKRALVASTEGYLAVAASTPTYDILVYMYMYICIFIYVYVLSFVSPFVFVSTFVFVRHRESKNVVPHRDFGVFGKAPLLQNSKPLLLFDPKCKCLIICVNVSF